MKLGTSTGSLVNHVYAGEKQPLPKIGDGATILGWTDRKAATVVALDVIRGVQHVAVQRDHAKRIDDNGMSESQVYEYSPNPDASVEWFSLRKSGQWIAKGQKDGQRLAIGFRNHYHDFSF
jgi:hypothetical protein